MVSVANVERLPNLSDKILIEQIRILYHVLLPVIAANLVVSGALTYGLWNEVSQSILSAWMSLILLVNLIRIVIYLKFRDVNSLAQIRRYRMYFILGSTVTGLLWGIGGVILLAAQELEYQLFVLFVLVGMGAGSVTSLTTYLPAFFSYFPISLIPVSVQLVLLGDPIHVALSVMTVSYIIALSYFGVYINRALVQSLKLRFENSELVEQLREQKDEAELANISKSKFLAAASHDLRQPLHALSLFTSVLDELVQNPNVRKVVDQINASVHALQNLFNALLDISRLEAGVMKVEKVDFFLQPLFDKLANDYDPQAHAKSLRISWPSITFATHSDPSLLEQILRNYVSNAIRYTEKGQVRISCDAEDGLLVISVTDTGIGIPLQDQKAIFQEFHQLNNPERNRDKGLGLGLAIVQRTANLLEHAICVESQPGKGSTFSITVERAQIQEPRGESASAARSSTPLTASTLMVVIDDELSVREGTSSLLQLWGCEVISGADDNEVITKLRQSNRSPDGIIADYRLRENHTGIEAIRAIHAVCGKEIPALIVTGDTASKQLREVNSSGFQVLHKPVASLKLRTFLRNVQRQSAKTTKGVHGEKIE